MIRWLLVDYGETISTPLPEIAINQLARLARMTPSEFLQRYWRERGDYDLGLSDRDYWARVLGCDPADLGARADEMARIDTHGWLNVNGTTLSVLSAFARRTTTSLALLSNAPEALASAVDRAPWATHFSRIYSCRIGYAKPDLMAFTTSLAILGADPAAVAFVDDRPENTRAAATLGLHVITYASPMQLARELATLERAPD